MPENKIKNSNIVKNKSSLNQISEDAGLMVKAIKLQTEAAEYGFDWPTIEPVFEKLQEEIGELKQELVLSKLESNLDRDYYQNRLQDELGDVLFCCMNLARFLKVDPSKALNSTNEKFERRFNFIESFVAGQGKKMEDLSLEELGTAWDQAKEQGL
ncbi:MAG: ATP diphosphatase [Oleiphilaceae bacterium]|jgi:ATP diphosphatase